MNSVAAGKGSRWESRRQVEATLLIIDDDCNNLAIMSSFFEDLDYTVLVAEDGETGIQRAAYAKPDLILLDIMMPGMDGYETCSRLKAQESTRDIPIICMTALAEVENIVKGFGAGAVDYVTKPYRMEEVLARVDAHLRLKRVTCELQSSRDLLEVRVAERTAQLQALNRDLEQEVFKHRRTEAALRASEKKFQAMLDNAFQLMGLMAPDGTVLATNRASLAFSGLQEADMIGKPFWEPSWWNSGADLKERLKEAVATAAGGAFVRFEVVHGSPWQESSYFDFSVTPVWDDEGRVVLLIPEARDITDRRRLEDQLRQSQKVEAIGTLAGGIAHDFNNILTAIDGYCSLIGLRIGEQERVRDYLNKLTASTERAATLISGLLAYSRKQPFNPQPIDLNVLAGKVGQLLSWMLGEDIDLAILPAGLPAIVMADAPQIEQVLMNLAANARDAMPQGGSLTIAISKVQIDAEFIKRHGYGESGSYALITVSDTGLGMDRMTQERIFEPFFTTKEVNKGTGLGLPMVYGIVEQHGGSIGVYSALGKGTTFKIYLPGSEGPLHCCRPAPSLSLNRGSETILLVEDDAQIRSTLKELLEQEGYAVIEAEDGEQGVGKFREHRDPVALLILDMVMPKMNGLAAYREIKKLAPGIKAIFMSGYTADTLNERGVLQVEENFISKPVSITTLTGKIREVLDRKAQHQAS